MLALLFRREWQLTKPFTDYAGEYANDLLRTMEIVAKESALAVRMGNINTIATPFTQKDTIRVVMQPGGNGEVIGFAKYNEGEFDSLNYADLHSQGLRNNLPVPGRLGTYIVIEDHQDFSWNDIPDREGSRSGASPPPHLILLFGNCTRWGSAFKRSSIFSIKRLLTEPACRGRTR